jgi:hypothetical protein
VKDEWYQKKKEFESDAQSKRSKLQAYEKQLSNREENLEKKARFADEKGSHPSDNGQGNRRPAKAAH